MANIKADEITKLLREQIKNYEQTVAVEEIGSVISVGDGIARIHGLEKCMAVEMLEFPRGVTGIALNLEEDQVGAVLLGEYQEIKEGDTVKRTGKIMSVPVGEALVGRVVGVRPPPGPGGGGGGAPPPGDFDAGGAPGRGVGGRPGGGGAAADRY